LRAVIFIVLAACGAGSMHPAVIPKLSELPSEPERRDGVLDSAHAQPGPENKPKGKKAQKAETYAATAAALIGLALSDHENVTLGGGGTFDENELFEDSQKPKPKDKEPGDKDEPPPEAKDEALVPWVKLK
jgi:hypothetical protein